MGKRDIESNLEQVINGLVQRSAGAKSYSVAMEITSTSTRSAAENAQILWIHWNGGGGDIKKRRRPWFTSAPEWRRIQADFQSALMAGDGDLKRAADDVGSGVRTIYEQHVREGKNTRGRMAPLSERYKKWKDKNVPGKPILVRTGQLLDSIRPKIQRM